MPLQSIALTPEQQQKFKEAGGLIEPTTEEAIKEENRDKMMYWSESFDDIQVVIGQDIYREFRLFKKVYEAFPDICSMTRDEAIEAGLYPTIHFRNFAACKWLAEEIYGGHLAILNTDHTGELYEIYTAAE